MRHIAAALMFGFCFAMVPLYSLICKATGINTSATGSGMVRKVVQQVVSSGVTVSFAAAALTITSA